jgi:hypothetical protein
MVDLSSSFFVCLPEGKPPFSYGFPIVLPLKYVFLGGQHLSDIPRAPHGENFMVYSGSIIWQSIVHGNSYLTMVCFVDLVE